MSFFILEVKLNHRIAQPGAIRAADAARQAAGGDVAHRDRERDNLHPLDQRAAVINPLDKMVGHALFRQQREHVFADQVVDLALADDTAKSFCNISFSFL